jgi:hypothetical protein
MVPQCHALKSLRIRFQVPEHIFRHRAFGPVHRLAEMIVKKNSSRPACKGGNPVKKPDGTQGSQSKCRAGNMAATVRGRDENAPVLWGEIRSQSHECMRLHLRRRVGLQKIVVA